MLAWLRDWSERRLSSRLMDERRSVQPQVLLDLGNQGFIGVQVEEKYGGLALRNRDIARLLDQAAAIDLSLGTFLLVCLFPGIRPLAAFGSPLLKDEVLPDLARGRTLAGYAQTEPGAGTHFNAMAAQAVAQPDGRWRVSGDKVWIGNAQWSNVLTVVAHDVDASGRRRGLTAFAVRTDQPGVALGREMPSMGMRGVVQGEVAFRDVLVDADHVVGEPKRGLEVGVDSMSWSRFAIASTCVGTLRRSLQLLRPLRLPPRDRDGPPARPSRDAHRAGPRHGARRRLRGAARGDRRRARRRPRGGRRAVRDREDRRQRVLLGQHRPAGAGARLARLRRGQRRPAAPARRARDADLRGRLRAAARLRRRGRARADAPTCIARSATSCARRPRPTRSARR